MVMIQVSLRAFRKRHINPCGWIITYGENVFVFIDIAVDISLPSQFGSAPTAARMHLSSSLSLNGLAK